MCKLTRRLHPSRRSVYVSYYAANRSGSAVLGTLVVMGSEEQVFIKRTSTRRFLILSSLVGLKGL